MKRILKFIIPLIFCGSTMAYAQISLENVRNGEARAAYEQQRESEGGDNDVSKNNEIVQSYSLEDKQKMKINSMASMIIMNAAVVGYGKACKFNAANIQRIEDYVIKQYQMKNEPLVLNKFREKIKEFENKETTPQECKVFHKEFNLILKDVIK